MVLPLGEIKTAEAAAFDGHPVALISSDIYKYGGSLATPSLVGKDGFLLDVTVIVAIAAEDTGNTLKKLDSTGDTLGSWDSILDTDRLENSLTEGIFLLVGTGKADIGTDSNGNPVSIVTGGLDYSVEPMKIESGNTVNDVAPKQGEAFIFSQGKTTATNIGQYFWRLDPENRFFSKKTINSAPIQVGGLQPGKDYYYQIAIKEDTTFSTVHGVAMGPVFKLTTLTDAEAIANNVNLNGVAAETYTETLGTINASQGNKTLADKLSCWRHYSGDLFPTLDVSGCVAELFNNLLVPVAVRINSAAGRLFDAFAAVSLGSTIYGQGAAGAGIASFVENGWSLVRDIANIFFIFILLYAALGLVLSMHHVDTKKLVAQVIIIALIINFSLFFCRVTIDASNILSRVFYNAMNVSSKGNTPITSSASGAVEQPISAAIIEGVQPQRVMSPESLSKIDLGTGSILMVLIISFVLNLIMAWIFFMCAAFFAGRIGVIWFSMIFAPLAFVTSIVPGLEKNLKQLGWHQWLSGFMKACFNAPIFFFFLYLIVYLVGGEGGGLLGTTMAAVKNADNGNWVAFLVSILLPTMIVVGLMMAAKKIAEDMAGEFGAAFAGIVAAGAGLGAMAITGGAAAVGSRFIGGAAANIASSDKLKDIASGKVPSSALAKWSAQKTLKAANYTKSASFDVRQTGLGNSVSKATGVNMNMGAGLVSGAVGVATLGSKSLDLSTGARAGGYDASVERDKAKMEAEGKIFASGYDQHSYAEEKDKIDKREGEISNQEDSIARKEEEIAKMKSDAKAAVPGAPTQKEIADKQTEIRDEKSKLRDLKRGTERVVTATDPKTGKATATRPMEKSDIGKSVETLRNDGSQSVRKIDAASFEASRGLDKMQKNLENIKVARMKAFHHSLMEDSGRAVHGTKRDALGNITDIGHMDHESAYGTAKRGIVSFAKDWKSNFAKGAAAGLAGFAVAGPVGAAAGVFGGFLSSGLRTVASAAISEEYHDAAHHATSTEKHDHAHYKDSYKAPSAGFFDAFAKVGSGGGGGGGHDDHGGGHDDHGGGGHH